MVLSKIQLNFTRACMFLFLGAVFLFNTTNVDAVFSNGLHTQGSKILDSTNSTFKISGVNWFGFETSSFSPHGLSSRNYKEMMNQMKQLGYNTIRIPYSNQALDPTVQPRDINYLLNPDLLGLSSIQVLDSVVAYAQQIGIKIILDRHRPDSSGQSPLWYTAAYPESRWISDWKMLAIRYKNNSAIIGADLHNEPHATACWGCGDMSRDWRLAAERAGNEILSVNSNWLIIVEGVQTYNNQSYWWGGNLAGVKDKPIHLIMSDRLVYSTHDYPASVWYQPWLYASNYPNNLPAVWDANWGYIQKENIAPVLLGEFGTKLETVRDRQWLDTLITYLGTTPDGFSWIYWSWNPDSSDTGGILRDNWLTPNFEKQQKLALIQFVAIAQVTPTIVPSSVLSLSPIVPIPTQIILSPSASPTTIPVSSPSATLIPLKPDISVSQCNINYVITAQWHDGFTADITIKNLSNIPLDHWAATWQFNGDQHITNLWNGALSQSNSTVSVENLGWNKIIPANSSTTFGFQATYSGTNSNPINLNVNCK